MQLHELAGNHLLQGPVPGQATIGTADETVIGRVPFKSKVVAAYVVPKTTITGAATHNITITVRNRKADDTGTAVPASLNFDNAINAAARIPKALTLSATAADLLLEEGDVITSEKLIVGNGIAEPAGTIVVVLQAR